MVSSKFRIWSIRILSILLPLCLLLSLMEVASRFIPPNLLIFRKLVEVTNDTRPYILKSDINMPFTGMYTKFSPPIEWRTNAQGLREDDFVTPGSNRFRIATYGDSETFGWSVKSEDTFQKQMEAIDPQVEVINFGVPGYNIVNIADHLEKTAFHYHPNLIIYLVHKNDLDNSLKVSKIFRHSEFLLKLRLLYQRWVINPKQKQFRRSPERQKLFAREVDRLIQLCTQHHIPLILTFLNNRNEKIVREFGLQQPEITLHTSSSLSELLPTLQFVNVKQLLKNFPKKDHHLSSTALRTLAQKLCQIISGAPDGRCAPPTWTPQPFHRHSIM